MFIWHVRTMQAAIAEHVPELQVLIDIPASAQSSADLQALLEVAYANLVKVSIDYAVMEKADNIIMAYGAFGWDDVGTWPAVAGHFAADEKNNVVIGSSESIDSGGNSSSRKPPTRSSACMIWWYQWISHADLPATRAGSEADGSTDRAPSRCRQIPLALPRAASVSR